MSESAHCDILPDLQNSNDVRNIPLHRVGVEDVLFPLRVQQKEGRPINTQANVDLYANLPADKKGVNMSRFVESLMDYHNDILNVKMLRDIVSTLKKRMESEDAFIRFNFIYFLDKQAPVSKKIAPEGVPVSVVGFLDADDNFHRSVRFYVFAQTLCPCSKEISKYGAHNQRAKIRVDLYPSNMKHLEWFEDVIPLIEAQASVATYPLLKRPDEKWVTEKAYDNPKFVEDVARDVGGLFNEWLEGGRILGFGVKVVSYESIHNHQAVAYYNNGTPPFKG